MNRSTGHGVGCGALLAAAGFAYSAATNWRSLGARKVAAAAACSGLGLWLLTRMYMSDPEARREYRAKLLTQPLSVCLKQYALDAALDLCTPDELCDRFVSECRGDCLDDILQLYTVARLRQLTEHGVVPLALLQARAGREVARAATSFTALWLHVPRAATDVPELVAMRVFDADALKRLFLAEYSWVREYDGAAKPGERPAEHATPGHPLGVVAAFNQYALFALRVLGIPKPFFQTVIATAPGVERESLPGLLKQGLLSLHHGGLLPTDGSWLQRKFDAAVRAESLDLWGAARKLQLRTLLEEHLVDAGTVAHLFEAAVPTSVGRRLGEGKEHNVVDFIAHWEQTLRRFPALLPYHLHEHMLKARNDWREAEALCNRNVEGVQKQAQADADTLKSRWRREGVWDGRGSPAPSLALELRRIEDGADDKVRRLRAGLTEAKRDIHERFAYAVQGYSSTGGGGATTINVNLCAQQ